METVDVLQLGGLSLDKAAITHRLQSYSFERATFLRPENLVAAWREHETAIRTYLALSPVEQRIRLAELLRSMWHFSSESLKAIRSVPRERFVANDRAIVANLNGVNVLSGKTAIESPWLLAYGASCLSLQKGQRVLVLGSGTGYSVALADAIVSAAKPGQVVGLEINSKIAVSSQELLKQIGAINSTICIGDAMRPESLGMFDAIWPTLSSRGIPQSWLDLLVPGGRICAYVPKSIADQPRIVDQENSSPSAEESGLHHGLSLLTYVKDLVLARTNELMNIENAPFASGQEDEVQRSEFDEYSSVEVALCKLLASPNTRMT